jgi:hypothetical protein
MCGRPDEPVKLVRPPFLLADALLLGFGMTCTARMLGEGVPGDYSVSRAPMPA